MSEGQETIAQAPEAAAQKEVPFARCPCGQVPTDLIISVPRNQKYGTVQGNCCAVWAMEFKAGFPKDEAELQLKAMDAWNDAPRAGPTTIGD
jgi:hypothetical protein